MEVVVRNIAPQRPFMRWPDPTTPGNTTKVTYKGCSTCAAAVTEARGTAGLGTLAKVGLFGFLGLPETLSASAWPIPLVEGAPAESAYAVSPEERQAIDAARDEAEKRAKRRLTTWYVVSWTYAVGAAISGYVHGYNRNKSVGWGLAWGAFGLLLPSLSIGWSLGQGYRKPRGAK